MGEDCAVDSLDPFLIPKNMEKLAECGVHFLDAPTENDPRA